MIRPQPEIFTQENAMSARHVQACGLVLLTWFALGTPASARYIRPELDKVPIERLVANLEAAVAKDPKNVQLRLNLARVHAMAYAQKTDTAEIRKGREADGAWFGYEPKFVPFSKVEKADADKQKAAQAHLAKALSVYRQVVEMEPDNLAGRIGHAWLLEQSGKKDDAVKAYRKLIDDAWANESKLRSLPLGGHTITVEAGGYLIALLDAEKDKDEIAKLKERSARLEKLPRPVTPIAVPLRDGLRAEDLEDRDARVAFDADGSGLPRRWTWITKDAGWLVFDRTGKGEITSGLQLFGSVSFWLFWENGYAALAALDDDGDGTLRGDELKSLAIWNDRNGNGVSEPGEVRPLAEHGVTAVSCRFERDTRHPDRVAFSPRGVTFRDGTTRPTFDLILRQRD
jgi:tetratricopeptide (TPR) repeat protein